MRHPSAIKFVGCYEGYTPQNFCVCPIPIISEGFFERDFRGCCPDLGAELSRGFVVNWSAFSFSPKPEFSVPAPAIAACSRKPISGD